MMVGETVLSLRLIIFPIGLILPFEANEDVERGKNETGEENYRTRMKHEECIQVTSELLTGKSGQKYIEQKECSSMPFYQCLPLTRFPTLSVTLELYLSSLLPSATCFLINKNSKSSELTGSNVDMNRGTENIRKILHLCTEFTTPS